MKQAWERTKTIAAYIAIVISLTYGVPLWLKLIGEMLSHASGSGGCQFANYIDCD